MTKFLVAFAGATRIPERSLALKAQANEADAAGKLREKGAQFAFDLSGALGRSVLHAGRCDAHQALRRGGADADGGAG